MSEGKLGPGRWWCGEGESGWGGWGGVNISIEWSCCSALSVEIGELLVPAISLPDLSIIKTDQYNQASTKMKTKINMETASSSQPSIIDDPIVQVITVLLWQVICIIVTSDSYHFNRDFYIISSGFHAKWFLVEHYPNHLLLDISECRRV